MKLLLIRIWSKSAGVIYDILRDGVSQAQGLEPSAVGPSVVCGLVEKQMALAIFRLGGSASGGEEKSACGGEMEGVKIWGGY